MTKVTANVPSVARAANGEASVIAPARSLPVTRNTSVPEDTDLSPVEAVASLKAELTSLRQALLGRSDDRTRFALMIERLRDTHDALDQRLQSETERHEVYEIAVRAEFEAKSNQLDRQMASISVLFDEVRNLKSGLDRSTNDYRGVTAQMTSLDHQQKTNHDEVQSSLQNFGHRLEHQMLAIDDLIATVSVLKTGLDRSIADQAIVDAHLVVLEERLARIETNANVRQPIASVGRRISTLLGRRP